MLEILCDLIEGLVNALPNIVADLVMAETLNNMKEAVQGRGGGLQSTSTAVGDSIAENIDTRGGTSKKADEAATSLGEFGKGSAGPTTEGTPVGADKQAANQASGSADHLELGSRK